MRLLRKKDKQTIDLKPGAFADKIAEGMGKYHIQVAAYLNDKTVQLSKRGKMALLLLICLLFGGMSIYLLINAFY